VVCVSPKCWEALSGCRCCCFGLFSLPLSVCVVWIDVCGPPSFLSSPLLHSASVFQHLLQDLPDLPILPDPTPTMRGKRIEEEWKRREEENPSNRVQTGRSCSARSGTHPPTYIHRPNSTKKPKPSKANNPTAKTPPHPTNQTTTQARTEQEGGGKEGKRRKGG